MKFKNSLLGMLLGATAFLVIVTDVPTMAFQAFQVHTGGTFYQDPDYRFSIEFPPGWEVKRGVMEDTRVKATHRDSFGRLAIISISAIPLREAVDLRELDPEELFQVGRAGYAGLDMVLLESDHEYINGNYAVTLKIETRKPEVVSSIGRKYHIMHANTLFVIDALTERDPRYYQQMEPLLLASVRTLRFLSAPSGGSLQVTATPKQEGLLGAILKSYGKALLFVLAAWAIIALIRSVLGKSGKAN